LILLHKPCQTSDAVVWVILSKKCCIIMCPIIRRYIAVNILMFQHTLPLHVVSSYGPFWRLFPPPVNTTSSYRVLVLVHRPGLRGHQISRPLVTTCGSTWRICEKVLPPSGRLVLDNSCTCRGCYFTLQLVPFTVWRLLVRCFMNEMGMIWKEPVAA
jgi:hypothetical protein